MARGPPGAPPGLSAQQQTDDAALIISHRQTLTAMQARLATAMGTQLPAADTGTEAPTAPFEPPALASKIETLGWLVSQLAVVQVLPVAPKSMKSHTHTHAYSGLRDRHVHMYARPRILAHSRPLASTLAPPHPAWPSGF